MRISSYTGIEICCFHQQDKVKVRVLIYFLHMPQNILINAW